MVPATLLGSPGSGPNSEGSLDHILLASSDVLPPTTRYAFTQAYISVLAMSQATDIFTLGGLERVCSY